MALNDYAFQLTSTGVILNDDSTSLPFVDLTSITGLDNAPYRETIRDHEGVDGGFIDAEFEQGRQIALEGTVYAAVGSVETYLDLLKANFAPVTAPVPLYLKQPGVAQRLVFVKPRGCRYNEDTAQRTGCTPIQFLAYAEDPRIYDDSLVNSTISYGGDTGVGLAFNAGFNVDFGGGAVPAGANFSIGGNRPTPVVFTITGPVINPVIINNTTGQRLAFAITLSGTDTLTINTSNRTVYLNGNINRRNVMTTIQWFLLPPGITNITYGGSNGAGSTLNVQYRAAWR